MRRLEEEGGGRWPIGGGQGRADEGACPDVRGGSVGGSGHRGRGEGGQGDGGKKERQATRYEETGGRGRRTLDSQGRAGADAIVHFLILS